MPATKLIQRRLEKVWGRRDLPAVFGGPVAGAPVGEICFEHPDGREVALAIKYLFTGERLSVQVHPDSAAAADGGHKCGKDEAWLVLAAEPGATIGLGLARTVSRAELRQAAEDGSLEALVDWRPAAAGDVLYAPAGTIHALGAGLSLIEVQQACDLTYRLYDYGRARGLHIAQAVAVARPEPYRRETPRRRLEDGREVLAEGRAFVLERWTGAAERTVPGGQPTWLVPLAGSATLDGEPACAGEAWLIEDGGGVTLDAEAVVLAAWPGKDAARR